MSNKDPKDDAKKPERNYKLLTESLNKGYCSKHGHYQGGRCPDCAIEQLTQRSK